MEVVDLAERLTEALGAFEPDAYSATDCALLAAKLSAAGKACSAAAVLAAARAAELGAHRDLGFSEPCRWVANQAGTTTLEAKEALETAKRLGSLPQTKDALLAGEISMGEAHEIARSEADSPGQEEELLGAARKGDLSTLRDEVQKRRLARTPPEELHEEQLAARRLRSWRDRLGMVRIDAALPPESGIPLVNRIEALARRLGRARRSEGDPEPFERLAADALVVLAQGEGNGEATPKATKAKTTELVIVCDLFAWRRGHAHDTEPCHIVGGGPIPVDLAKELSEDAFLKVVLHDAKTIHLVSHPGRRYPAHLRTALDLGPVPAFSGRECADCGRGYGLENDHVDPVAHTGPTSYANLQPRCYPCHAEKTERDRKAGLLGQRARARAPRTPWKPRPSAISRATGPPGPAKRPPKKGAAPDAPAA
ncbi:MAG: HNH endonuclease signature motif containing protein [Acidimicrobiales bacterium]